MPSTFPSTLTTFTDPLSTDRLNAPSHSGIETNQNSALEQIEAVIGTTSSTIGTIQYDLRAAASNGGGHIQTVNKGGTGQTAYNKGDIIVASSGSVLAKLSVGSNDQVLTADSTQSSGVKWAGVSSPTNIQNQQYTFGVGSLISASVIALPISPAPSALSIGQGYVVKFPFTNTTSIMAVTVSSLLAIPIKNTDLTNPIVGAIKASMMGIMEFDGVQMQLQNTYVPTYGVSSVQFLRNDATWAVPASTLIPNWVDEGSLSWSAETTDKTLTPTNTGKDMYMLLVNLTIASAGDIALRFKGDTGSNYVYVVHSNNAVYSASGTSFVLTTDATSAYLTGTVYISGAVTGGNGRGVSATLSGLETAAITMSGRHVNTSSGLTSLTVLVNGQTATGKVHLYSLNF